MSNVAIKRVLSGVEVSVLSYPYPRPRLQRERGAGWVNETIVARNRARLNEAKTVYFDKTKQALIVPSWFMAEFLAQLDAEFGGTR